MPSITHVALLALGLLQASVVSASPASASADLGLFPLCTCPGPLLSGQLICSGNTSQCTSDQLGASVCCAPGQKAVSGKCVDIPIPSLLCTDGKTICSGKTQCTQDNKGAIMCCGQNQNAINGKCVDPSYVLCSDGRTICSGSTPQCCTNVSIFVDSTGGASSNTICCGVGQKALNGKCYPGNAKLQPCYQNGPCDWGNGYYCAWNAGNGDSKCCKMDEYYKGTQCIKKP
ncbi:hypothetical protein J3E68DRAFT_382265 [Trichoderma sp. SZMC 28012]